MAVFGEDQPNSTPSNSVISNGLNPNGFFSANLVNWVLNLLHAIYVSGAYVVSTLKPKASAIEIYDPDDDLLVSFSNDSVEFSANVPVGAGKFTARQNSTDKLRYAYGKLANAYPIFRYELGNTGWELSSTTGIAAKVKATNTLPGYLTGTTTESIMIEKSIPIGPYNLTDDISAVAASYSIYNGSITLKFYGATATVDGVTLIAGYYNNGAYFEVLTKTGNIGAGDNTVTVTFNSGDLPTGMDIESNNWTYRVEINYGGASNAYYFEVYRCYIDIRKGQVEGG